ncbi:hypothetical protein ON010_g9568 [Phytophthora cinnamomi]|nr:hypothetical protein ON010_g9568 [Phytophthora cinnamomi]
MQQKASGDAAVDELALDKLSLEQKRETPPARERPRTSGDRSPRQERGRRQPPAKDTKAPRAAAGDSTRDHQQQLKRELTKINKQLKDIVKLEDADASSLTMQQKQKIERKTSLQQQRNEIIAELNGATVMRSNASTAGPRPKVAISL